MWVLFLFVCERARVSVVWSPLGCGVVSIATAPVSWYFSAAQENDNCQPLVPAGFVGCFSASLLVFVLLGEARMGASCLLLRSFILRAVLTCWRDLGVVGVSVSLVKSFARARCRKLLVCPFACETCPCCLSFTGATCLLCALSREVCVLGVVLR